MVEGKIFLEDKNFRLISLPVNPPEYILKIKPLGQKIHFPRGTLEEVATSDAEHGKIIIDTLSTYSFFSQDLKKVNLSYDSIISFAAKAYLKYEKNFQNWKKEFLKSK